MCHRIVIITLILSRCSAGLALEPDEILVIANADNAASMRIARYYCQKRDVPSKNILTVSLGIKLTDTISRSDYEKRLAEPIRERLFDLEFAGKIRCLLTTYGLPYKVGPRGPIKALQGRLKELEQLAWQEKNAIERLQQNGLTSSKEYNERKRRLLLLQMEIDHINGKETAASVDSELSMVLFGAYELYRWQPNMLSSRGPTAWEPDPALRQPRGAMAGRDFATLMVSRLDGPNYNIVKALVDKAIAAEKNGLKGIAYIDSRGLAAKSLPGRVDQSLRDLAMLIRLRTGMPVKEEPTEKLFAPAACPKAAIYCGWYSLKNYVDAFDFVDGAIGYHISSFEAVNLREPNSSQWCPAMLRDGITATLGAVAEPYLHSFPQPNAFFGELFNGRCLVEAFYRTKPFNSWQLILIGDPLYRPFKTIQKARTKEPN